MSVAQQRGERAATGTSYTMRVVSPLPFDPTVARARVARTRLRTALDRIVHEEG